VHLKIFTTTRNKIARPNKKTVNEETEDEQPLGEDRGLTKKSLKVQTLQERVKLKNKDSKNLKNKFYKGKKNLKNVTQKHEKRHSNKE
jgi:hypothetical protein